MRYPAERKETILKKMAPPISMTISELAEQEGIAAKCLIKYFRVILTPDLLHGWNHGKKTLRFSIFCPYFCQKIWHAVMYEYFGSST